jgi:hypothetical protein
MYSVLALPEIFSVNTHLMAHHADSRLRPSVTRLETILKFRQDVIWCEIPWRNTIPEKGKSGVPRARIQELRVTRHWICLERHRKQEVLERVCPTKRLLSAVIVEELELVWVCCGWRTPPTTHLYQFHLLHDSSRQQYGVTVTRCCSYSCFVLLKMCDSEARNI